MTTFYLDPISGDDANDGTSFANRFKTLTTGATAARIAPGDTIRVIKSPDATLVGDATWTNDSNTITLAGAVTATIANCDSVWTASANVTATVGSNVTNCLKEGTGYANLSIASGFTTGKVAYFATGTVDLSAYQQVSFWLRSSTVLNASVLELRLCTDTTGDTAAHTVAIPIADSSYNTPITYDFATNLNSAIQSVSLWAVADPGTRTVQLDNIIACKASSSADSLTLTSLIGKKWNQNWAASTSYAQNDIVRPSIANRNGFVYRKTDASSESSGGSEPTWPREIGETVADGNVTWECYDVEESWYPIKSISGTTVIMDKWTDAPAGGYTYGTYQGASETVATYKREPMVVRNNVDTTIVLGTPQEDGTYSSQFTVSGGWDRTNMSSRDGETWIDGAGVGRLCNANKKYWTFDNVNCSRMLVGYFVEASSTGAIALKNCHLVGCERPIYAGDTSVSGEHCYVDLDGTVTSFNNYGMIVAFPTRARCVRADANGNQAGIFLDDAGTAVGEPRVFNWVRAGGNQQGIWIGTSSGNFIRNLITKNNEWAFGFSDSGSTAAAHGNCRVFNWTSSGDAKLVSVSGTNYNMSGVWVSKYNGDADKHIFITGNTTGGGIETVTDVRHTASGVAWRFDNIATEPMPLRLPICKVKSLSGTTYTFKVWTRRSGTQIEGRIQLDGGQIPGVPDDVTVSCAPSVDTWTQSSALTWTPSDDGVVEINFETWSTSGGAVNFWIDDMTLTAA